MVCKCIKKKYPEEVLDKAFKILEEDLEKVKLKLKILIRYTYDIREEKQMRKYLDSHIFYETNGIKREEWLEKKKIGNLPYV